MAHKKKKDPMHVLSRAVNSRGPLQMTMRCHLIIDKRASLLLKEVLPNADSKEISKIPHRAKIELLVALGLLSDRDAPMFRVLAKVRNKFAHDSDYRFSASRSTNLWNCLSDHQAFCLSGEETRPARSAHGAATEILRDCLSLAVISLETCLNRVLENRAYELALAERIQKVVGPRNKRKRSTSVIDKELADRTQVILAKVLEDYDFDA